MDDETYSISNDLQKTVDIKHTYGFPNQTMAQKILWMVTIIFIYQIMGYIGGLFRSKWIRPEGKDIFKRKQGILVWWVM